MLTGIVTRRPIPKAKTPSILNPIIVSQKSKNFPNLPLVIAQLSFIEITGPDFVSTTIMGAKENLTAQKIPGIMRRIKPPKIVRQVRIEVPKYLQNVLYS